MDHTVLNKSVLKCIEARSRLKATAAALDPEKLSGLAKECDEKLEISFRTYRHLLEENL